MATNRSIVEQFFNDISEDYANLIHRSVPRYYEMLWAIIHYIPLKLKPKRILELGCGTGNLSKVVRKTYPNAELVLVDVSKDILTECNKRLSEFDKILYEQEDIRNLNYPSESFDLIISSITIHHIENIEKAQLFKNIYKWLNSNGVFAYSDLFASVSKEIYFKHDNVWHEEVVRLGLSETEWNTWMKHQDESDYYATLSNQLLWLKEAHFEDIDVTWRYLHWTTIHTQKR